MWAIGDATISPAREEGVTHAIVNMPNAYEPGVLERLGEHVVGHLA